MCSESPTAANLSDAAARDLARFMEKQLGYPEGRIDPIALRLCLQAHWQRIANWAHLIHANV